MNSPSDLAATATGQRVKRILNAGSGRRKIEGAVNLDLRDYIGADVVHDLNQVPYPFPENYFDEVILSHIVEHLYDCLKCFREIHRICKSGALVHVVVPHYTDWSYWANPDHRLHFSSYSFDQLAQTQNHHSDTQYPYRIARLEVHLQRIWRVLGLQALVNLSIRVRPLRSIRKFWEGHLSFLIRAATVNVTLRVLK
ncbi:MAG: hypothetical protein A2Z27_00035 [candidate division Zixibacteria bacterium RBG_16_50_21]|nr:MAG: hypothetical protein A2Z27_00035 [candidate division Zixibacteria bacterium RBG_16_50_21]